MYGNKKAASVVETAFIVSAMTNKCLLSQLLDVTSQLRLQVCSLILMNNVYLGELVQSLLNTWEQLDSCSLVFCSTQFAYSITHGLSVIPVVESSFLLLADSLD